MIKVSESFTYLLAYQVRKLNLNHVQNLRMYTKISFRVHCQKSICKFNKYVAIDLGCLLVPFLS